MKRRRRKRSTRRRGMQHIGDILAELLTEIDADELETTDAVNSAETPDISLATAKDEAAGQGTFAFYHPAEV